MGIAPEPPSDRWDRSMGSSVGFLFPGDLIYHYVRLLLGALESFMAFQVAFRTAMRGSTRCLLNGWTGYAESWSFFIRCPFEGARGIMFGFSARQILGSSVMWGGLSKGLADLSGSH